MVQFLRPALVLFFLTVSAISYADTNIEIVSTLSETGCSGSVYLLPSNTFSEQQTEWIKSIIQFAYNSEAIGGCQFDEFTSEKTSLSKMNELLKAKQFRDFLGRQLVDDVTKMQTSKSYLLKNKNKLELINNPEKICKSSAIQSYLHQQNKLLDEMKLIFKLHREDNPLSVDCD